MTTYTAVPFLLLIALGALAWVGGRRQRICRRCNGTGLVRGALLSHEWRICPRCHGRTTRHH